MGQEPVSGGRRRRRSSEQVNALVLRAARDLFLERGYDGTTIAEVSERSGVSRTVLFRHFPDKAALHRAALEPSAADKQLAAVLRQAEGRESATRESLLAAGRELFSAHGYAGTATRQIAEQAGVPEASLFRQFGSKAGLFREAVFEPFGRFIGEYVERWEATPPPDHTVEDVLRDYLDGLFRLLRANSASAMTLLAARAHEPPGVAVAEGQQQVLHDIIEPLEQMTRTEARTLGYTGLNPAVSTRASVAMVLAMALFKEWLFEPGTAVTDEEIIDELQTFIIHGIAHRPSPR